MLNTHPSFNIKPPYPIILVYQKLPTHFSRYSVRASGSTLNPFPSPPRPPPRRSFRLMSFSTYACVSHDVLYCSAAVLILVAIISYWLLIHSQFGRAHCCNLHGGFIVDGGSSYIYIDFVDARSCDGTVHNT